MFFFKEIRVRHRHVHEIAVECLACHANFLALENDRTGRLKAQSSAEQHVHSSSYILRPLRRLTNNSLSLFLS